MQFRTKIPIPQTNFAVDYNSKMVSMGSCFAENMAEKLDYFKFQNTCNPFGILFNPISMERMIYKVVHQELFTEEEIFFHNERWHCFDVHSDKSNANKEALLANLNAIIISAKQQLQEATHIIITYGTSWVYRNIESKKIVANCHKVPQAAFRKEILSIEIIEKSIQNTINLIRKINPNAHFIFTVSPVRHLKDGFIENQQSKAHLISAIHKVLQVPPSGAEGAYFPSYEIMMDELRDYRFYAEDMIHPSQLAIDYIWQRFAETTIAPETHSIMKEVETIQRGLAHKPFHPNAKSHQQFLAKLQEKTAALVAQYSFMKF